jgi:hypothetical protein
MSDILCFIGGFIIGIMFFGSQDSIVQVLNDRTSGIKTVKYNGNIYILTPLKLPMDDKP